MSRWEKFTLASCSHQVALVLVGLRRVFCDRTEQRHRRSVFGVFVRLVLVAFVVPADRKRRRAVAAGQTFDRTTRSLGPRSPRTRCDVLAGRTRRERRRPDPELCRPRLTPWTLTFGTVHRHGDRGLQWIRGAWFWYRHCGEHGHPVNLLVTVSGIYLNGWTSACKDNHSINIANPARLKLATKSN